jgi:predicted MFS family arabinose efflux permease
VPPFVAHRAAPLPADNSYRALSLIVGGAFFMEQLDSTIIAPAVPQIARAFGVDPLSLNLTMTVYLLCCIVFIPTGAFLARRYGTRTVFQTALALFMLSSALCALSNGLLTLTLARALQGASAALMVPVGRIAIVHATKRSELVMALAWMITPAMVGPLLGPSFWAGSLVRVGYGALPFLLPLLLQIGLGFSAIQSGVILLASGAVAFVTKTRTAAILRRYGFRSVLIWNGTLCALALAICASFSSAWGALLIAATVSLGGLFRSIQFNALAAIAYADMPPAQVGAATTLNTTIQQLAVMLGISASVVVVELSSQLAHRQQPAAIDFSLAFVVMAALALAAVPFCMRLLPDAGDELSGHVRHI